MRLAQLAGPAAVALLIVGCAPEYMATHAVPARQAPPSLLTPAVSPSPTPTPEAADSGQAEAELHAASEETARTAVQEAADPTTAEPSPPAPPTATPSAPPTPTEEPGPAAAPVPSAAPMPVPTGPSQDSGWRDLNLDQVAYSDAWQLAEVSPSFRDYAVGAMSAANTDGCTVLGLSIMSVHPDGYVVGSLSTDCGGGQAIWREGDRGTWEVAMLLQAAPQCHELAAISLPKGVGLVCEADGTLSSY